jgi:hypothetical protein
MLDAGLLSLVACYGMTSFEGFDSWFLRSLTLLLADAHCAWAAALQWYYARRAPRYGVSSFGLR